MWGRASLTAPTASRPSTIYRCGRLPPEQGRTLVYSLLAYYTSSLTRELPVS